MNTNTQQIYQNNLQKNLNHRLEVAKTQSNQKLVKELEREATTLHLDF